MPEPREQALVRLRADGLEHERAVLRIVESDRRETVLRDRRLHSQVADRREHERLGLHGGDRCGGRDGGRRNGWSATAVVPEGGQEQGHDPEHADDDGERDPARAGLGAAAVGSQPSSMPRARCRRRHGLDRSKVQPAPPLPAEARDSITAMAGPGPTIQVPRWIQLVVLPVLLVLAFLLAKTLGHVLFLFLTAGVIALTLNPLVRDLTKLRVPRGLAVAIVYMIFAAAVAALLIAVGAVAVDQTKRAANRIDDYVTNVDASTGQTAAEEDIDSVQAWLDSHGLQRIQIRARANDWLNNLGAGEISTYAQDVISFVQGAAL